MAATRHQQTPQNHIEDNTMRRRKMGKRKSRRVFKKTAGTHKKNLNNRVIMRGGIRL